MSRKIYDLWKGCNGCEQGITGQFVQYLGRQLCYIGDYDVYVS